MIRVDWVTRRQMPTVLEIERRTFEFPWTGDDFQRCLRQRNCIGMFVHEEGSEEHEVSGYMVYELFKNRIHVINFAVDISKRRGGIGKLMIDKLKSELSSTRRQQLLLEVRESNLNAQLFFRSQGFRAVNVMRNYYDDTTEDAYLMVHRYAPMQAQTPVNRISKFVA